MSSYKNYRQEDKKFTRTYTQEDLDSSIKETNVKSFETMKEDWKSFCSYYREYPDFFIDLIKPKDSKIELYFYQRLMLRVLFRYQNVYITMTRGTAKSYTQILALYLKCIMFPSIRLFLCAPTAKQASSITKQNVEFIWSHFPLLKDEIAKEEFSKDYTRLIFKNGSQLEVMQVAQSTRGARAHGGSIEEIVDEHMKKDILNEVVIPTMANDRRVSKYGVDKSEVRKSVAIVTTCGTRQSFAYEKLLEVAGEMARGESSFILGCGYELPVMHDQLELEFIEGLQRKETYNPLSFQREYQSIWSGSSDSSLVSLDDIKESRILEKAEHKNTDSNAMYVLSYDVARAEGNANANSALVVLKCLPLGDGNYSKHVVNVYSFEGTHFLEQAKFLKKMVDVYKASVLVIDSNGIGKGLIDYLVTEIDDTPPYSVINDSRYDEFKTARSVPMIYALSSSSKENRASDIHNLFISSISNKKVKFLVSESQAKLNINSRSKKSKSDDNEKVIEELKPYIMTDIMIEEIMNLEYKAQGNDTQVKQISRSIPKDKFSALEYALWWIHLEERKNFQRKREVFNPSELFLVKKAKSYRN